MKIRPAVLASAAVVLLAWAASPATAEPWFLEAPSQCALAQMSEPFAPTSKVLSYCQASCLDGSARATNCSGTCSATDQVCTSSGATGGSVTCNGVVVGSCNPFNCSANRCEDYFQKPCRLPLGTRVECYWDDGRAGFCDCGHKWICA